MLPNHFISGFIISATRMSDHNIYELKRTNIPFVLINRFLAGSNYPCVRTDFFSGIQKAVSHLVSLGHREILLLNGPEASQASQLREEAFIRSLAKFGILYNPDLNLSCQPNVDGGFNCIIQALGIRLNFTAVITYNELMAEGVLDALHSRNIDIPGDISVVSFDDTILASHSCPPLTSIRQESELLGRCAVEVLISIIEGEKLKDKDIVLEPELIVRKSSSTARLKISNKTRSTG